MCVALPPAGRRARLPRRDHEARRHHAEARRADRQARRLRPAQRSRSARPPCCGSRRPAPRRGRGLAAMQGQGRQLAQSWREQPTSREPRRNLRPRVAARSKAADRGTTALSPRAPVGVLRHKQRPILLPTRGLRYHRFISRGRRLPAGVTRRDGELRSSPRRKPSAGPPSRCRLSTPRPGCSGSQCSRSSYTSYTSRT